MFWPTLVGLAGCSLFRAEPTPVLLAPADTPAVTPRPATQATSTPIGPSAVAQPPLVDLPPDPAVFEPTPTPTPPPPPEGAGVRPQEAQLFRPPETGPESPVDWRPPPLPVPHSLHPDDHYWLIRPLPSGSRNYDLEWYPYGIEPTLASALPYRVHHGMDFPNDTGTPIFAASSGTVIWAGPLASNRDGVNYYGNTVIIHHDWQWQGKDVYTLYAHTLELFVEVGDTVEQGQLIAGVGASGEVSGPHLHLEVRVGKNNYNSTSNPALWLAPYEGWGTLAGRFEDERGRPISAALVTVRPENVDAPTRVQRTYFDTTLTPSDEVWRENFVVGDLPAGRYTVLLSAAGQTFRRTVEISPGQTTYVFIQADFAFFPTATPHPTATPTHSPANLPAPAPTPG
ncbi:MAG: peptidoglycan DD-metalloendopeptidase family protein [Chloroflexi bacterium]|nr:peptidoglycan DD-metalloendopeptidase family protein [Chloroflexota bacterium]MCI0646041.1 peptidoglycan DD-metalloendopeptidase family protein [Chloroflexota bacterium]MCI0727383.1 peptidoglycan DD-metalloendopeptidase family protein [Chloroflexota bacterium]